MADEFSRLIGSVYATTTGELDWPEVGGQLSRYVGADWAHLGLTGPDGTIVNRLNEQDSFGHLYASHYKNLDPFRVVGKAVAPNLPRPTALLGDDIIAWADYARTEFYADYMRQRPTRHLIAGILDANCDTTLVFFRGPSSRTFSATQVRAVNSLLPHVVRALQLRTALRPAVHVAGLAALDALTFGAAVVDSSLRVVAINTIAEAMISDGRIGLRLARPSPTDGRTSLCAVRQNDNEKLQRLVSSATAGHFGGAMRMATNAAADKSPLSVAVLVSPAPSRIVSADTLETGRDLALVIVRALAQPEPPSVKLLCDLFGLSSSEADVARLILGGVTAETVAQTRQVSLDTVRRQIQSVLRKSEAINLRDFERIAGSLRIVK